MLFLFLHYLREQYHIWITNSHKTKQNKKQAIISPSNAQVGKERMMNELDDPWCRALHECTVCLRDQNAEDADTCLAYLGVLEQTLERELIHNDGFELEGDEIEAVNYAPSNHPPGWRQFCVIVAQTADLDLAMNQGWIEEIAKTQQTQQHQINSSGFPSRTRISVQRLLTRIFTSKSEVFAMKAMHTAKNLKDWTLAAAAYETAIHNIHQALDVTDTAISRWWGRWETGVHTMNQHQQESLVEDASIVVVALESLIDRRDMLLSMSKREESKLLRKLQPQWESRDEVKQRMGTDRWKNNPSAKHDYSNMRTDLEAELKDLQKAILSLEELDPRETLEKASDLQEQMRTNNRNINSNSAVGSSRSLDRNSGTASQQQQQHRYNMARPSPEWMAQRVSLQDYPDPVDFEWIFTGSWEAVEFFEKTVTPRQNQTNNSNSKLVKLDWYFTTATIKTSLDHPVQGKTQLFAKQCDPRQYVQVLTNPRTHTGNRYHRKPNHRNKSN